MPDLVRRLDEGAADIVVADDAEFVGQAGLLGVAHGCRDAGIRHRDHDVGRHAGFTCQLGADGLRVLVDATPSTLLSGRAK